MIYLDNAATSFPKPDMVTDAVMAALTHNYGTPGRGTHIHALKSAGAVDAARKSIARFFRVLQDFRVVFTYSATDALNMAIKGFINEGDRVLISAVEHNSVSRPVKRLEAEKKIRLDIVNCDEKGYLDLADLKKKLKEPAKLVVINHASNVTGALQPVEEIGKLVRESGAYLLLDASQTAGRVPIDMQRANVDMLAAAGHKGLFGLQGTGFLIIGERISGLRPFREGGTGFDSQSELQPVSWPEAFESGTHNVPGIMSMAAGLQFIEDTGLEKIAAKEHRLLARLYDGLAKHPNITIYGPAPDEARVAVLSFNIDGWEPADIGDMLNMNNGISVRTGLQCAPLAHRCTGTFPEGTVRVSPGYFNSDEDIDKFLNAVGAIAEIAVPLY